MAKPAHTSTPALAAPASARRSTDLGVLALAALAGIWGYGWVVGKVGLGYAPPFEFVALRTALCVAAMFALLVALRRPLRPPPLGYTAVIGLLQTTGFIGLTVWTLANSTAGKTSVLTYTMPFWLLLLAWALLGERLRGLQWLAVSLSFAGLVLVLAPWRLHGLLPSVLTVVAGFSWAASAVAVKLLQRRHEVDVLSLTTWQMLIGLVPLIVVAAFVHEPPILWNAPFLGSLLYTAFLGNGLAWMLWLFALRALPAGAAGIGTLAVPVLGVLSAWLQLGERPDGAEAAGMALIIAALALVAGRSVLGAEAAARRRPAPEEAEELPHA